MLWPATAAVHSKAALSPLASRIVSTPGHPLLLPRKLLGLLKRNGGVPEIHLQIPAQPGLPADRRGGQADYHEGNTVGGLMQPALQTAVYPKFFTLSNTGLRLVAPPGVPGLGATATGLLIVMAMLALMGTWKLRQDA